MDEVELRKKICQDSMIAAFMIGTKESIEGLARDLDDDSEENEQMKERLEGMADEISDMIDIVRNRVVFAVEGKEVE